MLIRRYAQVATARLSSLLDQLGNRIDADHVDAGNGQCAGEPALAAAEVEHRVRLSG